MDNNSSLVRAWLENPERNLSNGRGSLYSRDGVLYSYGAHWPLATIKKGGLAKEVLRLNTRPSTATTGRHRGLVQRLNAVLGDKWDLYETGPDFHIDGEWSGKLGGPNNGA